MSTTIQATRLRAPLPQPRAFSLLTAANIVNDPDSRWLAGAAVEAYPPGPAHLFDPCSAGTFRAKEEGGVIPAADAEAFTVYLPISCTARSVGAAIREFRETLDLSFAVYEPTAVEEMLATGGGFADQYLGDANLEVLGGGAVTPLEGLNLLEGAIPFGNGIIHVPPETASYWAAQGYIEALRGQMVTKLGTRVAVGEGYTGVQPDGEAAPGAGEQWAFATGPIDIHRDTEPRIEGGSYAEALDRTSNDLTLIEERDYLLLWVGRQDPSDTTQVQAGVLIDRIP
jgi:hypothetical protein